MLKNQKVHTAHCNKKVLCRSTMVTLDSKYAGALNSFFHHFFSDLWTIGSTFQGSVSLNAGMFVSEMLASRTSNNVHVALLMGSAVEIFALAPRVYRSGVWCSLGFSLVSGLV